MKSCQKWKQIQVTLGWWLIFLPLCGDCECCIWKTNSKKTLLFSITTSCLRLHLAVSITCSRPCNNTFIFCPLVLSPLIPRNVTYLQNCDARGRRWSICFHCFTKLGSFVKKSLIWGPCPDAICLVLIASCHARLSWRWWVLSLYFHA